MSEEELLSQDELDVLANGVDEGDVETGGLSAHQSLGPVQAYDLTNQDHIVRGRLPTLEMINERFTQYTEKSMFKLLRQTVQVGTKKIENIKFSEYLQTLGAPVSLNMVKINPLKGTALFTINAELVVNFVDLFFGGGCHDNELYERAFTVIEKRIIQKILNGVFVDMKEAWQPVMDINFEYMGTETNPSMVKVVSSSEVVVLSTFDVNIAGKEGKIQVVIPYSMLEPVRETLDSCETSTQETDHAWINSLQEYICYASVLLSCRVAERKVKLRDILSFKVGDVIPIDMPESSILMANGVPMFGATMGVSNQHLALKIKYQIK